MSVDGGVDDSLIDEKIVYVSKTAERRMKSLALRRVGSSKDFFIFWFCNCGLHLISFFFAYTVFSNSSEKSRKAENGYDSKINISAQKKLCPHC